MIQSPLNYTGGKYKLLPQILPLFPKDIDVFVDLFCGGCNVGINVDCNWVIYNDLNENLLYLYNTFKNLDKKSVLEWIYEIIEKYNLSLVSKHGYDYYGCESSKGLGNYNREGYLRLRADFNQKHANENFDYYYYVMLYKQIYSIKELIQQERTVWFVRESKDTDSQNEIVLLNSDYVQPNNFSKKYFQSHGSSLLWLSDLHLADSDFSVDNDETTKSLFEHIQGCLSNVQDEIGGLIITGDITSTAEKNGFEKATKLIDDLSRNYVFTNENIAICPGNHDFKFSQKDLDVDEKPKAVSKLYTKAYSNFYKSVYNISPNEYYCCGKKILLSSGHVVEIVALNSLYLQQHQNFNGHGYLSEKQLNFVATEMGWNNKKARNVIRIVMMHHHYLPVCYTEAIDVKRASSVVYDADRLMNWMIKHDVKVLLHGHKHKSIVAQVTYPDTSFSNENNETQMKKISVIGMGGTGCKHTQNLFGTLGFDDNKLYIKFYQIYSDESSEDSEYQTIVLPLER